MIKFGPKTSDRPVAFGFKFYRAPMELNILFLPVTLGISMPRITGCHHVLSVKHLLGTPICEWSEDRHV